MAMRWWLVVLAGLLISDRAVVAAPGDAWEIDGNRVNLRSGPTTASKVKRKMHDGQMVIEHDRRDDWLEVELPALAGVRGWVHASLLRRSASSSPEPEVVTTAPPRTFEIPDETVLLDEMRDYVVRHAQMPREPAKPKVGQSGRVIIGPVPIRKPGDQSRVPTELVLASSKYEVGVDAETVEAFRDSVSYLNSRAWSVAGIKLFSEIEPLGGGVMQVVTTSAWSTVPTTGQKSYLNTLLDRWSSAKADGGPAGVMLVDPYGKLLMHQTKP